MRSSLILLVLACGPAFCQNDPSASPDTTAQKFNDNLRQRINDILNPQNARNPGGVVSSGPRLPQFAAVARPMQACSIPLLNVVAPGTPVHMPNMMPRTTPRVMPVPPTLDRMSIVVPAPACPANFGKAPAPPTRP